MSDTERHLDSVERHAREELSDRVHEIKDGRLDGQWWFITVLKSGFRKTRESKHESEG